MIRYLLNVSYIGAGFRGVTFIEPYYSYRDLRTIQGVLEAAVKHFFKQRCEVCCSSRTDARVHALQSTFHVDVKNQNEITFTDDIKRDMIAGLNGNLKILKAAIRINDVDIVDDKTFSAFRNVQCRSYMYRIAVKPKGTQDDLVLPIEEISRCYIVESDEFDIVKFERAAQMFVGVYDFRSFMKYSKEDKTKESCYAQRTMYSVTIEESQPCVIAPHTEMCNKYYKFYDIKFTANSFVYRQIRRIIGALCAVAEGRINERDIYELLTIPSFRTWNNLRDQHLVGTAPAYGLYFIGIHYKPKDERSLNAIEMTARGTRVRSIFDRRK